jgi:sugar/nucleoside kinase (ribokinase family)
MSEGRSKTGNHRVLGVIGALVWDTILHRDGRTEPLTEWGGIGYALEALSATLPTNWEVLPLMKVGCDLSEEAYRFLHDLPRATIGSGVQIVAEPNNRVEIRYAGQVRLTERLTGGVPPWEWNELEDLVGRCDALYINFISGFEIDLETARRLRDAFAGPIYADLHSLFLGIGRQGARTPQPLPHWAEWITCFDAVQMNEQEFELLGRAHGDPWKLAADVVGADLKLIAVTLGERGAAYIASAAFAPDPFTWPKTRGRLATPRPVRSARIMGEPVDRSEADPTGCGDVWGATCFAGLLAGKVLEEAISEANRMAARNLEHKGAPGLGLHLAGRLETRRT